MESSETKSGYYPEKAALFEDPVADAAGAGRPACSQDTLKRRRPF